MSWATRRWGLVGAFLLLCAFLALAAPPHTFLTGRNLTFVLLQISVNMILAAVLGALIIGVLSNGLVLLDVSAFYQMVVKGMVILGAVALDRGRR